MKTLSNFLLLPELKLTHTKNLNNWGVRLETEKISEFEVCPKCATKSHSIYDRRTVTIRDEPIRGKIIILSIIKRRFMCKSCRKPFTEPIPGITKGKRTTARFQRAVTNACENFTSLKSVQNYYKCSAWKVYKCFYEQLAIRQKHCTAPAPKKLGIDEHSIRKRKGKATEYATIIVDHGNKKVYDLIDGRNKTDLISKTSHIKGFEDVKVATLDLSPTYRGFLKEKCPKAMLVADRFHVQRLLTKLVNKFRLRITGDKRKPGINKILLMDSKRLDSHTRRLMHNWLKAYPELYEVYQHKEALHRIYRIRGWHKAKNAFGNLLDRMGMSLLTEVQELRKVFMNWRREILNYFNGGYSNGRVEGFNRKAKLLQRKAYGIKNFENYRLRLLNDCR
jgi:transposase